MLVAGEGTKKLLVSGKEQNEQGNKEGCLWLDKEQEKCSCPERSKRTKLATPFAFVRKGTKGAKGTKKCSCPETEQKEFFYDTDRHWPLVQHNTT